MKTKIFILSFMILAITGTGCKKFLQVDPKSTMGEDQLLSSEVGFQQALIGIYSQVASRPLYGDYLSMSFASLIAQNYSAAANLFPYAQTVALNFKGADAVPFVAGIWSAAYNTIAGTNNILEKIDARENSFTGNNYALIKGETLGLRAYLHFDLLRLYGANFATNPTKKAIPYRTELNALSKVPSTVDEVSANILADLKIAEGLMKDKDPITTDKNRRFRMNYYAIKALQARVYLFRGDKTNAAAAANEVVSSGMFTFVLPADVAAAAGSKDRTFSTEQVLAIRVKDIKNWTETTNAYFRTNTTDARNYLTRSATDFDQLYEVTNGGSTDLRYVNLIETEGTTKFCTKFWQTWVKGSNPETARLDQIVPLIRMSEMYYILAETAATPAEGLVFLNKVREKRVLPPLSAVNITPVKLTEEITKEYQKEFFAEGQLFFYYKRKLTLRMLFGNKNLSEANYIVPVPDNELEFNPNYN